MQLIMYVFFQSAKLKSSIAVWWTKACLDGLTKLLSLESWSILWASILRRTKDDSSNFIALFNRPVLIFISVFSCHTWRHVGFRQQPSCKILYVIIDELFLQRLCFFTCFRLIWIHSFSLVIAVRQSTGPDRHYNFEDRRSVMFGPGWNTFIIYFPRSSPFIVFTSVYLSSIFC